MRFVSFRIFVYCFCIVLVFHAFCMMLLYRAKFSCFLYSTIMAPPCHGILNCLIEQRFLPQILINSILVCTILWVEHNGHRRIQIVFPSHPSSYVRDLDFLGFILCLESVAAAEAFVTSTLAFMYPSLLYAPRFTILSNPPLSLSSLR